MYVILYIHLACPNKCLKHCDLTSILWCVFSIGEISLSYRIPSHISMQIAPGFPLATCPWWCWSWLHKIAHSVSYNWPERPWFLVDNPFNNVGFGDLCLFFNKLVGQFALPNPRVSIPDWSPSTFLTELLSGKTGEFDMDAQALMVY